MKAGRVAVAGVAWAQHKGIEAVEVRVDGGPWHEATLAAVPGIDTWRQWVWQWPDAAAGPHLIEARATDKTGYTQTALQAPKSRRTARAATPPPRSPPTHRRLSSGERDRDRGEEAVGLAARLPLPVDHDRVPRDRLQAAGERPAG